MKPYYTNHNNAAWMAKNHWIRFVLGDKDRPQCDYEIIFRGNVAEVITFDDGGQAEKIRPLRDCVKLYVHPDSMDFFESCRQKRALKKLELWPEHE